MSDNPPAVMFKSYNEVVEFFNGLIVQYNMDQEDWDRSEMSEVIEAFRFLFRQRDAHLELLKQDMKTIQRLKDGVDEISK